MIASGRLHVWLNGLRSTFIQRSPPSAHRDQSLQIRLPELPKYELSGDNESLRAREGLNELGLTANLVRQSRAR